MAIEDLKNKANEKVNEIKEKAEEIKKDLDNFKEKILSKEEREKKLNELKEKVQKAREELKEKADTLKDSATEKVQATLDSLNEQINLSLAILKNTRGGEGEEDEKKGFFKGIGDWFSEKWNNFKEKDTKGKAVTVGAGLAGIGLIAWRSKGREKRKADREAKKAEREAKREERRQKRKERWGKFLKRLGVGALLAGGGYAIKKGVDKRKEKAEEIESKMEELRGFESDCKKLKERADKCLEMSHYLTPTNHKDNQKKYEEILADAVSMQRDAIAISAEIGVSNAKNEVKTEANNLKNSIDSYAEEIKAMRPEIYALEPEIIPETPTETTPETPTETTPDTPTETTPETPTETAPETPTETAPETPTETTPERERKTPESELGKLRGFESECKDLKEKAEECLRLARSGSSVINYVGNQEKYEEILANILSLQTDATSVVDEMSRFRLRNRIKTEMNDLKKRIDDYVEEVKAMKPEIYAPTETPSDPESGFPVRGGGGFVYPGGESVPETPTETTPETPTETTPETPTETTPERERKTPESELGKLRGFEAECKNLKEKAEECLRLARSGSVVIDYEKNQEKYEEILANILSLQTDATSVVDEMSRFRLRNRIKTEMDDLKKHIDDYVEEVKAMKPEIYAPTETPSDPGSGFPARGGGGFVYPGGETTPETPTETTPETPTETTPETPTETTPETFQPVSATVLTNAAMDYLDVVVKEEILNKGKEKDNKKADRLSNMLNRALDGIKQKARKVFQDYFKEHPILKKSESKKMVFEIDDPSAFGNMFKEVYDKSVPRALKQIIPSDVTDKINDISKTLRDADVKTYKDIAFPHFGTLIQNAVKTEHGTMTVQTYYDGFSRAFPNRHDSQIARDLASSGQADKDIKVAELSSIS